MSEIYFQAFSARVTKEMLYYGQKLQISAQNRGNSSTGGHFPIVVVNMKCTAGLFVPSQHQESIPQLAKDHSGTVYDKETI